MEMIELWTLRMEHEYYQQGHAQDTDITVSSEMKIFLMRRNLIWRRKSFHEWSLYSFDDYSLNDEDKIELEIITTGDEIHYVTDLVWPASNECIGVKIPVEEETIWVKECSNMQSRSRTPNSFMKLSVPIGQMINRKKDPFTTKLVFQAIQKYWEYILLPRQSETKKSLRLEDTSKTVIFKACEPIDFMGHKGYKIRSEKKIPLQERYKNIDLILWETFPDSNVATEHILLRHIPFPDPTLQLDNAQDTALRILYY